MDSNRDQIEEIKNRLDIVDVVNKYVQLKQAGKNFSGLCPFHSEKTPSFIVSPEIQRYKCFGCGESGDIFNFIQNIEHIDFPETLEKLAKDAGVILIKKEVNSQYTKLEDINKKAAIHFYKSLHNPQNKEAMQYLKDRGITDESIKNFGIGYSSDSSSLLNFIQKDIKYNKDLLLKSGLFIEKEGKLKSKFFKRIMFPIRSSSGKVIAFTARVLPNNNFGPKYMNSPETDLYHKKDNLYGQYESRQEIRKEDLAIICEGTTDVISAYQSGIKNIVAPLGTALTREQLKKLSKLTKNILFLFDSDRAGQQALERAFLLAVELNLSTYAASTLPFKDIDEMVTKDVRLFRNLIKKRVDTFTYLFIEKIKDKNLNKLQEYQKILNWTEGILQKVPSDTEYSFYVKKARQIGKIDIPLKKNPSIQAKPIPSSSKINPNSPSRVEVYFQNLLYSETIKFPQNHELKFFKDHGNIYQILQFIQSEEETTRSKLLEHFKDETMRGIIENAIFSFTRRGENINELDNIYKYIVKDYFSNKEKYYNIKIAIAEEKGDQKESIKLLNKYQNLTKQKKKYEQDSQL